MEESHPHSSTFEYLRVHTVEGFVPRYLARKGANPIGKKMVHVKNEKGLTERK
jgi:hypothetical protein